MALILISGFWTAGFAALTLWDRSATTPLVEGARADAPQSGGDFATRFSRGRLLWLVGTLGTALSFLWFLRLEALRERGHSALRRNQHDLAAILRSIEDLVFALDADGRISSISGALGYAKALGETRVWPGKHYREVLPANAGNAVQEALARLTAHRSPQEINFVLDSGGTLSYWTGTVNLRQSLDGPAGGSIVVMRDVTSRGKAEVALRESAERWRLVYECSVEGIVLSRPNGTIVSANPAACNMLGLSEAALIQTEQGWIAGPSRATSPHLNDEGEQSGTTHGEFQFRRSDGTTVELEASSSTFQLSDGEKRVVTIMRDITARRQAERVAQEHTLRWQAALEAVGDGLWDWNIETDEAFFSPSGLQILGYDPAEITPRMQEWRDRIHADDLAAVFAVLNAHLAGETDIYESEHRLRTKNGGYKWILARGKIVSRSPEGRPLRMIGTHKDRTLLREAAQRLKEGEERYSFLFNHVSDGLVSFPLEAEGRPGLFAEANEAAWRIVGCTREELLKKSILDLETAEKQVDYPARLGEAERVGRALFETEIVNTAGVRVPVEVHAQLFQRHEQTWVLASMRDITLRREAAAEIERFGRERLIIVETLPVGICVLIERKVQWANGRFAAIFGYETADIVGVSTTALYAQPADSLRVGETGYPVLARGEIFETEVELLRRDGTSFWGILNGRALNAANPSEGSLWAVFDVTARKQAEAALRASEEQLESILSSTGDGILAVDEAGRVLRMNQRFADMWRLPRSLQSMRDDPNVFASVLGQLSEPEVFSARIEAIRASPMESSDEFLFKDGRCFECSSSPLGIAGRVVGRVWSFREVTKRVQAERARRESDAKLASTLGALRDLIVVLDPEGRFVECHRPEGFPLMVPVEQFLGAKFDDLLPAAVGNQLRISLSTLAVTGEPQSFDYELAIADRPYWWAATVSFRQNGLGQRDGAVVLIRDITERKRVEQALRESEEKFHQMFFHAPLVIIVTDWTDGRILEANDLARKISGIEPAQGIGRTLDEIGWFTTEDRARLRERLKSQGQVSNLELTGRKKSGEQIDCLVNCQLVTLAGKTRVITAVQDITERKAVEAALRDKEQMLRESQKVAALGSYVLDIRTGRWQSSVILDEIFGVDARFERSAAAWTALIAPVDREAMADYLNREVMGEGKPFDRQYRIVRLSDGAERWVHGLGKLEFDDRRQPVKMVGTIQDITARKQAELALRESEERYRTLVELSPEAVFVHDHGRMLFANHAGLRLAGAESPDEVLGGNVMDFVHPDSRAEVEKRIRENEAVGQRAPAIRQKWHRLNGEVIEVSVVSTRVMFGGQPATLAIASDITAQLQAEVDLRKLSRAVEQSPVTVVITNRGGVIEYVNPSFTAKTGYTLDEVRGKTSRILRSGETPPEKYRELWKTILAGHEWRGEFHNRKKNGELFWEAATVSPIFDDAGHITHFLAVKEDITEQKAVADRTREQAALLDVTQDGILLLNLEREITYLNRAAEGMYGWSTAQALGRRYESIAYQSLPSDFEDGWKEFLASGTRSTERRQVRRTGEEIVVRIRGTLVRDENGRPRAALIVVTDITEAKKTEANFLRAQRLENLGALAGGVAHDLNNVLTPILVATELLRPAIKHVRDREVIQLIGDSARRGAEIVQQLLLYGRGSETPRTVVDVGAVVRGVDRMMRETFPKNISLRVQSPKELWSVEADPTQIHQVLLNLCVNARDAMPKGGKLSVTAENLHVDEAFPARQVDCKPGPYVALRVTDTGTGIPAEHLEKIFDPFFTTKPIGQGTGLGLASVLGITRSHGGFVSVTSQAGSGTTFTVLLPAKQSLAMARASERQRQLIAGRGELVLLVDDELMVRTVLAHALEDANYRVVTAANGAEALTVFAQQARTARVVVTDMMMPIMDGTHFVHALRKLAPTLPVVAVSGLPQAYEELARTQAKHLRFIPKPFLTEAVLQAVRELIDEAAPPS